jgi:hypothetical protein
VPSATPVPPRPTLVPVTPIRNFEAVPDSVSPLQAAPVDAN